MKKLISLILAVMMLAAVSVSFAENSLTNQIGDGEKKFNVTFQLPEGATVLSEGWTEGMLYQANIQLKENEYLYMSIDGSEASEDGSALTYNEANGWTDDKMLELIDNLFGDGEYEDYEKRVVSTAYGTKIAMIRVNDEEEPMAYAWTRWNGFEIGLTLTNVGEDGDFAPVTDEQIENMVAFASEVWMHMNVSEANAEATEAPAAELTPEQQELAAVSDWMTAQIPKDDQTAVLSWDLDTIKGLLDKYEGELKYYTKDQVAELLNQKLSVMKEFMDTLKTAVEPELTVSEEAPEDAEAAPEDAEAAPEDATAGE